MRGPALVALAAAALTCCSSSPSPSGATDDIRPRRAGAPGTVETVAGPGFCTGRAVAEPTSESVRSLAVDAAGRVFFETGPPAAGLVAKMDTDGRVSKLVVGGASSAPAAGDQGTESIGGRLVADGQGGIFLAAGTRVLRVGPDNALSTVAGDSSAQPHEEMGVDGSGDRGPASAARLAGVKAMAADQAGGLYIADVIDRRANTVRIRFLNTGAQPASFYAGTPQELTVAPGDIATIAGRAGPAPPGDAGPARDAVFQGDPVSLAVAGTRLYVGFTRTGDSPASADAVGVRLVNLGGVALTAHGVVVPPAGMATVAGGGPAGDEGDGGQARAAALARASAVATDVGANLYIADEQSHRVRKVDPSGTITTFAGGAGKAGQTGGFDGNDRPAAQALLQRPVDIDVGPGERVYISDRGNDRVRVVDRAGVIRAVPGNGLALSWRCGSDRDSRGDAMVESPRVGSPAGVAADSRGNVFVAARETRSVLRVDPSGVVTAVAGNAQSENPCPQQGSCPAVGDGGPAANARFGRPAAVELGAAGQLYVLDSAAARVWAINLGSKPITAHGVSIAPGAIATVAGSGTAGFSGDGGPALRAQLGGPGQRGDGALAADGQGNLFIADVANHRVRRVDAQGAITTFAGEGAPGARSACCKEPDGLAVDGADNLYVADGAGPRVWAIGRNQSTAMVLGQSLSPDAVVLVAGNGSHGLGGDGARAVSEPLPNLMGITVDAQGSLYLAGWTEQEVDRNSQLLGATGEVRKIDGAGTLRIVVGNGQARFNGDGLKPKLTSLNLPTDVAVDRCGNLLVADQGNDRVRRLSQAPCTPQQQAPSK